ncbi:uncharacterized protein LOC115356811 isoform X2 [Myripristis murdjan]|nr:uncharacterized protein LOC115356811 isoform X2 [Myripristis murdjan]
MSPATILNYMKNIIRFLDYLKTRVDLESSNPELRHRWDTFVGGMKSVRKCQEILQVAKKDFLNLYGKLITNQPITENEKTMYGYYLEAVMVFQHFQRPGAVEGMTVDEFVNRKECNGRVVVGIKQHKTATMQVAALALTLEEDAWFEAYYQHIRTRHETVSCQSFFIGSTGAAVHKVTNDIRRLQDMYKVDRSTSQEVRRAAETQAAKNFTPAQKEKVARYMAHTTQVAEAHYRMMLPEQTAETAELMMVLNDLSPDNSDGRGNLPEKVLPKRQFSTFLENFPVTLDGSAPPAKKRKEAGFPAEDRSLTDKWHKIQRDHRAEYLLSKFRHRQPTQRQFDRCVEGMKWETNKPKYPTVLKLWTPPHKEDIASNKQLIRSVMTQRWKGLSIKDFGGDKGKGVIVDKQRLHPAGLMTSTASSGGEEGHRASMHENSQRTNRGFTLLDS